MPQRSSAANFEQPDRRSPIFNQMSKPRFAELAIVENMQGMSFGRKPSRPSAG
jgi:hypothetical protein